MLDNLKLGYGGTKTEMERLLADAEKLTGIHYNIDNFADITQAIHAIQTQMGITGTTAREASTTIEGSVASMSAAWQNLVVGMADDNADLDQLISNFVDSVKTAGENVIPRLEQILTGFGQVVQQLAPILAQELPGIIQAVLPSMLEAGATLILALVSGLTQSLPALVQAGAEALVILNKAMTAIVPEIFASIGEALPERNTKLEFYESQYTSEQIEASIGKGPIIQNGTWWVWNVETGAYQDTGIYATIAPGSVTTDMLAPSSVTWPKLAPEARKSNPTLLENSYFIGGGSQQGDGQFPINQRGLTEYTAKTGTIYTIDRWHVETGGKIALTDDDIVFTTPADSYCVFGQRIENYKDLIGKTLTLSVLIKENTVGTILLWAYGGVSISNSYTTPIQGPGLYTVTFTPNDTINQMRVGVQSRNAAGSVKIAAFKLELGPNQTLAYESAGGWILNDPAPNFTDELMRCQRYYYVIRPGENQTYGVFGLAVSTYSNTAYLALPLPVQMRARPTAAYSGDVRMQRVSSANGDYILITSLSVNADGGNFVNLLFGIPGAVAGEIWRGSFHIDNSAYIALDANL